MHAKKTSYSLLLKNPAWQKKRLQILERDNFACKMCGDKNNPLHIHHKRYINDNLPWEYQDDDLITLCEYCHKWIERSQKEIIGFDFSKLKALKLANGNYIIRCFKYDGNDVSIILFNAEDRLIKSFSIYELGVEKIKNFLV